MYLSAFTQANLLSMPNLSFMLNLSMTVACSTITSLGGYSHMHGAGAWARPCHVDKPERSSSGSRHAPRTSPHQALSAFIFLRNDQWQTSKRGCNLHSSLALTCRNLRRLMASGTGAPSFFTQFASMLKGGS